MSLQQSVALRRLRADWEELQQFPLRGIAAAPLAENLQEWHANLTPEHGHYAGLLLHVILSFPDSYPTNPPRVRLCTNIPHSNVIPQMRQEKNFICIDMLKNFFWMGGEDSSRPYEGWSTAYGVSSILLQVQCFLFDDWAQNYDGRYKHTLWDAVIEEGGHRRTASEVRRRLQLAQEEAVALKCHCGHCGTKPWPEVSEVRMPRIPGIHLAGDTVELDGRLFRIDRVLADGKFEVTMVTPEGGEPGEPLTVTALHFGPGPYPWTQEPPKSHTVTSAPSQALAAKPIGCQLEAEVGSSCSTLLDSSSEALHSATSVISRGGLSDLPLGRKRQRWQDLQVGMEVQGRVMRQLDMGFFLDIGFAVQGLLRRRVVRGLELKVGDSVKAFVASVDQEKWRVDLALRQPVAPGDLDAWQAAGTEVVGLVVGIQPYGLFVDVGASETGLVHVSRLGSLQVSHIQLGDEVHVQITAQQPKLQLTVPRQAFVAPVQVQVQAQAVQDLSMVEPLPGSLAALPKPVFARVLLEGLNLADLGHLTHASRSLRTMADEASSIFWDVRSLCCFHTRARFNEDGCILGVGIAIVEEDGRKHLTCDFDPLSQLAFDKLGVRKGVWRNQISYWLPLAVDAQHFDRAAVSLCKVLQVLGTGKVAEQTRSFGRRPAPGSCEPASAHTMSFDEWLAARAKKSQKAKDKFEAFRAGTLQVKPAAPKEKAEKAEPKPRFDPSIVLDVLPKLMNSQVVLLMKGETWASHKALSGYMGFHHLLLSICRAEPLVQAEVERRIAQFMSDEDQRVKAKVPNLGEFICLLAASEKYDWPSVASPLLVEVFDRNVLWLLKKYPHLGKLSDVGVSQERLRATFQAALVSMRLIMFNAWFLNNVAKPAAGRMPCSGYLWAFVSEVFFVWYGFSVLLSEKIGTAE